eukprot:COSAG01_NODE_16021_length_1277_cov_9.266553_1_plen_75_part_10
MVRCDCVSPSPCDADARAHTSHTCAAKRLLTRRRSFLADSERIRPEPLGRPLGRAGGIEETAAAVAVASRLRAPA